MNENRTKNEREPNEERTRSYREPNEKLSLRFEVHFIHYMQHGIARHSVVPCLGASLRVDYLANVRELTKQVEAIGHYSEFAEGALKTCVPHEVVGVHRRIAVAVAAVHGDIGGQLQL